MSQSDTDDMDVDETLEEAIISYVNMHDRENGASSCHPQGRLRWIKEHQNDIRAEMYQCLQDVLHVGETNAESIGKRTILPSSLIGGRRDMTHRYEDGMAILVNGVDVDSIPSVMQEELAVDIPNEDIEFVAKLNNDKLIAFKTIMNVIGQKHNGVFFIDDPGGTELHGWDAIYMVQRAILKPTNDDIQKLNDMIIDQFPGEEHNLLLFDEVEGDNHNLYQQEFLNSIAQGNNAGKRAFLLIIKIKTSASDGLPFVLSGNSFLCD
ncbi:hypothetical protein KIW84_052496 [Lathyrus oleraceus]|uniref:Helitron helicase-like domain-containing protein n=1 Tax=Pisum sativum TaxID=3888 RepID=A0A9D4WQ89_PEA|nr:hypothetical protein KIW84_052496 [Pisum sativum]